MQLRYISLICGLVALLSTPAAGQQAFVFGCTEDVPGTPSSPTIGGFDLEVEQCFDVLGLSSGLESAGDVRTGRPVCGEVEVLKRLDVGSPIWLTLAIQRTRVQRIDLLFFALDPGTGEVVLVYELSLRQSLVTGVAQDVEDGQPVERLTLAPTRIVATIQETGAAADIRCDTQAR